MTTASTDLLPSPVRKYDSVFLLEYPFPIIRSDCKIGEVDPKWNVFVGYFEDNCVLVHDDESIKILFTHGYFGKGTLSKNAPKICCELRDKTGESCQASLSASIPDDDDAIEIDDDETPVAADSIKQETIEVVLSDSSDSNPEKELSPQKKEDEQEIIVSDDKESLQLTLEEAYFLSYALGCLIVKDNKNQPIDLARLWDRCCRASPDQNFPVMYTAYHHFRSKGWVVKPGIKYGVDYLLYKDGPPFYHATYSVLVKPVKEQNFREMRGSRNLTWASLFAINRLNSGSGKAVMFLYVIKPSGISENKMSTPFCISQYKLEEVLFERWVPSENREEIS